MRHLVLTMTRRNRKNLPAAPVRVCVEALSHDGRGVARVDGKTVFIDGALPGEEVWFAYRTQRRKFDEGTLVEMVTPSAARVTPECPHFSHCGGCALQHLHPTAQIRAKQQQLLENLRRIGNVEPEHVLEPVTGPVRGYRRKARLGARYVAKKGKALVGFREKHSSFIADLERCRVLHPHIGERIGALKALLQSLQARERIPQIEVAVDDSRTALVFRHLEPLVPEDIRRLVRFGEQQDVMIFLQSKGPETATAVWPRDGGLCYTLPQFEVALNFSPTDFTQVNLEINRTMVALAVELLELDSGDVVMDFFCGLGNFSLPMARRVGRVIGIEGNRELVAKARANARQNALHNAEFHVADLFEDLSAASWADSRADKILLDPPRSGAQNLVENHLAHFGAARIAYVSCNAATLARDAGVLVHRHGYRLAQVGLLDMFPHTVHSEAIALFVQAGG